MDDNFRKFWVSFEAWFLRELSYGAMLKDHYKTFIEGRCSSCSRLPIAATRGQNDIH